MSAVLDIPAVLTLEEVAAYLRVPQDMVMRQVTPGELPGRKIEDTWRFLKDAIDDWLRSYESKTLLLQQAGALANDQSLGALREHMYTSRQRPELEKN